MLGMLDRIFSKRIGKIAFFIFVVMLIIVMITDSNFFAFFGTCSMIYLFVWVVYRFAKWAFGFGNKAE